MQKRKKKKRKIFLKTIIQVNSNALCCCTFMQKIKKTLHANFQKLEKPLFGPTLGPYEPENPRTRWFSKNPAPSFIKLDGTLTSCKKLVAVPEKKLLTNEQ